MQIRASEIDYIIKKCIFAILKKQNYNILKDNVLQAKLARLKVCGRIVAQQVKKY